jgi:hypothetical protein
MALIVKFGSIVNWNGQIRKGKFTAELFFRQTAENRYIALIRRSIINVKI